MTSDKTWSQKAAGVTHPGWPRELLDHPQYEVIRELGRGGMGVVYLAKNKLLDRLEVLKVVSPRWLATPGAMERFLREIQTAAKLRHENVVVAYSAIQVGELLGFAMEYIDGQDLYRLVQSQGPLSPTRASDYVRQAALGLQHAHDRATVHRDIKPQNLIVTRDGKRDVVKILDFGLAKATRDRTFDSRLTDEGTLLGTPDYVAPEQILDAGKADIRADVYSLGCTAYFLLTGRTPFQATNVLELLDAHRSIVPERMDQVRPEVPRWLADVVARMMAKDPARRFQNPIEVAEALSFGSDSSPGSTLVQPYLGIPQSEVCEIARESATPAPATKPTAREPRPKRRLPWRFVVPAIVLAGIGIGAASYFSPPNVSPPIKHPVVEALVPPPPPPEPEVTGILVLDDCDPQSSGKRDFKDNLTLFDKAGDRIFRVSGFNESQSVGAAHRIATDPIRKLIWVIEDAGHRVRQLDYEGKTKLTIDDVDCSAIAVDPDTGHAWVVGTGGGARPGVTVVYDVAGKKIAMHKIGGIDITYDAKSKSFWIAFRSVMKVDAATGVMAFSVGVASFVVSSIDADPKEGGVWVAVRGGDVVPNGNRLLRFDANGDERLRVELGENNPFSISVDDQGGAWVGYLQKSIERFSAKGISQAKFDIPALAVLAAHDGGAWAVTPTDLRKVTANGDTLLRKNHTRTTEQAWLAWLGRR